MNLELVSFKICPFVQRSIITLNYKQSDYKISYIELDDPPEWFRAISPLGKVPVLKVDDSDIIFESAVINEFLDEVTPGPLLPSDPLTRAHNRAWIEFGSQCIIDQYLLGLKKTQAEYEEQLKGTVDKLRKVEAQLGDGPYFNGESFSLTDAAYAPALMRYHHLNRRQPLFTAQDFPKLTAWTEALMAMDSVRQSVVEDFEARFFKALQKRGGYAAELFTH